MGLEWKYLFLVMRLKDDAIMKGEGYWNLFENNLHVSQAIIKVNSGT